MLGFEGADGEGPEAGLVLGEVRRGSGPSQSAVRVTSAALGALMRKVTRRSEWTSGDTMGAEPLCV